MHPWWYPTWRKTFGVLLGGLLGALLMFGVAYALIDIPDPNAGVNQQSTVVRYADGTEIGRIGEFNRREVALQDVPDEVRNAVLAAENRTFYSDAGISPIGIARAFLNNIRGGSTQGGSTITQQYAKISYLSQERTITRKIKEAFIAIKIDQKYTKDQILEDYLNAIYFGRGAYGIQAAADAYFGKPVQQLGAAEGAILASIIKSPSTYDPLENREEVEPRWRYVLDGMAEAGWLDAEDARSMKYPKVIKPKTESQYGGPKGHLLETVRQELVEQDIVSEDQINRTSMDVTTTFQRRAQISANRAVRQELPKKPKDLHAGLAAIHPRTGGVVAMYGGPDYLERQYNDATQSVAQAGSTFKPFALAAALEEGIGLKSRFNGDDDLAFPPERVEPVTNFNDEDHGWIDLIEATESSVNTVYVKLGIDVGPRKVVDVARRAGIPQRIDIYPNSAVPLGTASPHAIDLANAYATFAAQGERAGIPEGPDAELKPYTVQQVKTSDGDRIYEAKPERERVFEEDVMADLTYALQQVVKDGSGFEAQALGRPAAGKTGTSNGNRSAWYVGYTPQLAAAVDIFKGDGNEKLRGIGEFGPGEGMTGGSYPARIWTEFMRGALAGMDTEQFPPPEWIGKTVNPTPTFTPTPTPTPTDSGPSPTPSESLPPKPKPTPPGRTTQPPWPGPSDSGTPSPSDSGWPLPDNGNGGGGGGSGGTPGTG